MTLDRGVFLGSFGARSRIGVVGAVYAAHATFALAVAWPLAKLLGDPVATHPRADRVLFEPGGLYLSETLRLLRPALTSTVDGMSFAVLVGLYLGLLPLGALLYALARPHRVSFAEVVAAAGQFFGRLSLLLGCALVAIAFAAAVVLIAADLLETKLLAALGDRGADIAEWSARALALGVAGLVGVVHDLARAALVSGRTTVLRASSIALDALRARPKEAIGGWALRGLLALALVAAAARVTTSLGVETASRGVAVALIHQGVAFVLVFLRADWLALAIGLVSPRYESERYT